MRKGFNRVFNGTPQILDMETRLYYDFGGWIIAKDDETYYIEGVKHYQRQENDNWVLIESNQGFCMNGIK